MKLYYDLTGNEVKVGDKIKTFRGDRVTIHDIEQPKHSASTGRVHVKNAAGIVSAYYPGVIDATWRPSAVERID